MRISVLRRSIKPESGPALQARIARESPLSPLFAYCCLVAAALGLIGGCATSPPVQEMSDARQAIGAAEEAGADRLAADALGDARRLLENAEQLLRDEAYGPARINAVRARNRAAQALAASQSASDDAGD